MSRKVSVESSEIYMLCPRHLRALGIELIQRTRGNAYRSHPECRHMSDEQRGFLYDELKQTIEREGFRSEFPITIMLLRKDGVKDKILQGHHRLSIAIELRLPQVPVRFVY